MAEKQKKMDLTVLMLISMIVAVIAGLVGGEAMTKIQFIGDIFFRLIQMSIPIFVLATVVKSVGGLTPPDALRHRHQGRHHLHRVLRYRRRPRHHSRRYLPAWCQRWYRGCYGSCRL